jgi:hypothetical protein
MKFHNYATMYKEKDIASSINEFRFGASCRIASLEDSNPKIARDRVNVKYTQVLEYIQLIMYKLLTPYAKD